MSNLSAQDSSAGEAAEQYHKSVSSNPTQVYILQLTLAVSDYHENFLFLYISEDDSEIKTVEQL